MGGFRRGTQGVERLLKGRKQGQKKEKFQAQNNSGTPSDAPSTGEKRGAGSLRIKTREAVLERTTAERGSGIVRPRTGPEKVRTGAGMLGSERPVEPCARPAPNATLTPQERGRQAAEEQVRQRAEKNSRQPQGAAHTAAKTAPQDSRSIPSECRSGEQHAAKQGGRRPTVASPEAPRYAGHGMNREGTAPPSVRKPVPSAKQIKTAQRSLASGPCAGQSPGCGKDFRHTVCPCCWSHIQGGCHMESANTGSSQGSTVRSQSGPRRCGCHCSRREHCPFYRGRTLSGRCAACLATWHPIRGWRQRSGFCFSIGGSGSDQWRIGGTPGANAGGC